MGGVNAQTVRADSINEDATEQVENNKGANAKTAEVKTADQKQENNSTEASTTKENAKQNVAENISDSKKVTSDRDVNVINQEGNSKVFTRENTKKNTEDNKAVASEGYVKEINNDAANTASINTGKLDTSGSATQSIETVTLNSEPVNSTESNLLESKVTNDLSGFDNTAYLNKLKSFQYGATDNINNSAVIRTVVLNKPTGTETKEMRLIVYISPRISRTSTPNGMRYTRRPVVMSEITTADSKTQSKDLVSGITFNTINNDFESQQDKENYGKFMSVNKDDISLDLPAFTIDDINVSGYSYHINTKETTPGAGLGEEKFSIYTEQPQTVVVDYTKNSVQESMQQRVLELRYTETARVVIMNKPTGSTSIKQTAKLAALMGASSKQQLNGKTVYVYAPSVAVSGSSSVKKYSVAIDPTTGDIVSGQDAYDTFMKLQPSDFTVNLPAIDQSQIDVSGYTWSITSATPAGAGLGAETYTFGNPQTITIDYKKEEQHTVTYQFEDPFGNQVGNPVKVTGAVGSNQPVSLTVPAGYQYSGDLPTSVTIPTSDTTKPITVKHQLTINISGTSTIDYAGYDWQNVVKTNQIPGSLYMVNFNDDNARVQLTDGDVTYNGNRNVRTYDVSLTKQGLEDIKDQLGDNFIYPDLQDVTSSAKFSTVRFTAGLLLLQGVL